jgi:uridine kinase
LKGVKRLIDKPYVITINAVSGGGKTALAKLIHGSLPASALFCFDDFSDTNVIPENFYEWSQRGADPLEVDCPGMGKAVEQAIQNETLQYVVLDCPLGREHPRFSGRIDLAVFIDTPLDVAMARRILRDRTSSSTIAPEIRLKRLRAEMIHYLEKARYPYLEAYKQKATSDLILDGWRPLDELRDQVLIKITRDKSYTAME